MTTMRRTHLAPFAAIAGLLACAVAANAAAVDEQDDSTQLEPVQVTGSFIARTNVETPSPVQIISRADIQRSGLTTIADVVRSVSADNSGSIPSSFTFGFASGSAGVSLRGLSVNSTLVLIDGRRAAPYPLADDGERSFVDLNTIPIEAVERVEVLKDGASSLYGADAIAGVVNVILKHSYEGAEVGVEGGTSQHGGGSTRRFIGLLGGGDLGSDRYNAYLAFEYQRDDAIGVGQRGFPFNTSDLSPIGGNNLVGGQPGLNSGSIYGSVTPGTLSNSDDITTGVPDQGAVAQPLRACGTGTVQTMDATGTYCAQNFATYFDHQPRQERMGLYARFSARLSDDFDAYMNALFYQNKIWTPAAPAQIQSATPHNTNGIALPPRLPDRTPNPNNPFAAQDKYALINYAFGDIPLSGITNGQNYRVVGGVRGNAAGWLLDSAGVINHNTLDFSILGLLNFNQLISDVTNGTYNFINPSMNSAATRAALAPPLDTTSTSDLDSIDFKAARELFALPGGSLAVAFGTELRREAANAPDFNQGSATQGLGIARVHGQRQVAALYGEVDAAVLHTLEIDASGRYDHYSDFGGSGFVPKLGIKWTPVEQAAFRGTYSKGFRAPSFGENGSSEVEGFIPFTPPPDFQAAHNNDGYAQTYSLGAATSANGNVRPEKSDSFTIGGVFQPLKPLSASLDYYVIRKNGVIQQSNPADALAAYFAGEPVPPGFTITPDNPDPAAPNALPRPIVVSAPYVNADQLLTSGIDLNLHSNWDLFAGGKFVSDLNVTKIIGFKLTLPDGSTQEYAGTQGPFILSSGAGTPRYRAAWANTVMMGRATLTGTIYFISGYAETASDIGEGCLYVNATGNPLPGNCRVSSFTDVDLNARYDVTSDFSISAGIENLFDREPPLDPINYAALNYNPTYTQAGIVGRFFRLGVRVHFD